MKITQKMNIRSINAAGGSQFVVNMVSVDGGKPSPEEADKPAPRPGIAQCQMHMSKEEANNIKLGSEYSVTLESC